MVKKTTAKKPAPLPKPRAKKPAKGPRPASRDEVFAAVVARAEAAGVKLAAGATEAKVAKAEAALGVRLPDDVRAWFLLHDGADSSLGDAIGGEDLLSLRSVVGQWKIWKGLLDEGTFEGSEGEPSPGVRPAWWSARWIPLTYDGSGNHDCLDLDPAPRGQVGQVIRMWHDEPSRKRVAPTFLDWLWKAKWGAAP